MASMDNTNGQVTADAPPSDELGLPDQAAHPVSDSQLGRAVQRSWKSFLDLLGLFIPLALALAGKGLFDYAVPKHIGFFCDDKQLKYPYQSEETVTMMVCYLVWALVYIFVIAGLVTLHYYGQSGSRRNQPIPNYSGIALKLSELFSYIAQGALLTLLITKLGNLTMGSLRPHFITLCKPKLTPDNCEDNYGYQICVTENEETVCENFRSGDVTKNQLRNARLSFISEHTAFSFYCGTVLICCIQSRISNFPSHQFPQAFPFGSVGQESATITTVQLKYFLEHL